MKNLLIIYPHWVPSNLAGVHRPRLIANYLPEFGWHPIILTVDKAYYEEAPDPFISNTVSDKIEVIYTKAFKVVKPRLIGDIGLRAFWHLYSKAIEILKTRDVDFVWIPIPSFYTAILGRLIFERIGVPYGIDYIDPWVRDIRNRSNLRARLSILSAKILEPFAVKKASLLTGVSPAYYEPVLQRNFANKTIANVSMPYGFDPNDHKIKINSIVLPWQELQSVKPFVYAGAFLPNSHIFIKGLFSAVRFLKDKGIWTSFHQMFFLGTGYYSGITIADYAKQYGIEDVVIEVRQRYSFLEVLNFLNASTSVMVIGSTEKHYTASKTYQALLSRKPVLAVFHEQSSAVKVLQDCKADGLLVRYTEDLGERDIAEQFTQKLTQLVKEEVNWIPDLSKLSKYSAQASASVLVNKLNELV